MKKKFALNLILLVFLNLLVKPFWIFGIDRTVQNMTGVTEYGVYFSLFNFSLLLNILLDMGVANFNNRKISQNPESLPTFLPNAVTIKLIFSVLYAVATLTLAFALGYTGRHIHLLTFLIINQFLTSFILYLRTNISGLQLFTTDSILSVTDRLIMVILCSVALWSSLYKVQLTIELFVYLQTAAYTLTALLVFVLVLVKCPKIKIKADWRLIFQIVKGSFPFALLVFLMSVYTRTDGVLLERLLPDGKAQAGIYAQAYRILDAANMFAYLFPTLLLPMFSKMLAQKEDTSSLVSLSMGTIAVFAVAFAFSCIAFGESIMQMLYIHTNAESAKIFSWLMLSFVPMAVTTIFGTLLTANGNLKALNIVSGIAVAINLGLNFILIPAQGALGAAIACFITQCFVAIVNLLVYQKIYRIGPNIRLLQKYFVLIALSLASTWAITLADLWFVVAFALNSILIVFYGIISGILPLKMAVYVIRKQSNAQ
jgi:O-antigen/teichoic acid export membrane protein